MPEHIVALDVEVRGCQAVLLLNGIPVTRMGGDNGTLANGIPVQQFVLDGANELEVVVNPGPTPSRMRQPAGLLDAKDARISVKAMQYRRGTIAGEGGGEELARVNWGGVPAAAFPLSLKAHFQLRRSWGPYAWESAPPLGAAGGLRAEIEPLLRRLAADFLKGEVDVYEELAATCLRETDQAYGREEGDTLSSLSKGVLVASCDDDWALVPLQQVKWDLNLCAGGRMVDCVAEDWHPILRSVEIEGSTSYFPAKLARLNGQLRIVR